MAVIDNIKVSIANKAINYSSTIADYFSHHLGLPMYSNIQHNTELSNLVTNIFVNTEVNVYIFNSNKATCISMPGASDSSNPEAIRRNAEIKSMNNRIQIMAAMSNTIYVAPPPPQYYEALSSTFANNAKEKGEGRLEFDPVSKKLKINIPKVNVFISTMYINQLDSDDEVIAVILFEVARNTTLFYRYVRGWYITGMVVFGLLGIVGYTAYRANDANNYSEFSMERRDHEGTTIATILAFLGVLICLGLMFSAYFNKREKIMHDEFVIKCGYGKALYSAIQKYNKFIFASEISSSDVTQGSNIFDKIAHWFNKIGSYISNFFNMLGITSTQSINTRNKTIESKLNYDTSDSNIDRTAPIR